MAVDILSFQMLQNAQQNKMLEESHFKKLAIQLNDLSQDSIHTHGS